MRTLLPALTLLVACGGEEPLCKADGAQVAAVGTRALTCEEADAALDYIAVIAARSVPSADKQTVYRALGERFTRDPEGTLADLAEARDATAELMRLTGIEAAERRAQRVFESAKGRGPLVGVADGVRSTLDRTARLWVSDEETGLAITELDVEGWLFYGSLCREVQGAGPLKLSIADRVPAYRVVEDQFRDGERAQQVTIAAMGPFWLDVKDRWRAASYDTQQRWISSAPLPPPMTASSLGYFEAVMGQPAEAHARALHGVLGPLRLKGAQ